MSKPFLSKKLLLIATPVVALAVAGTTFALWPDTPAPKQSIAAKENTAQTQSATTIDTQSSQHAVEPQTSTPADETTQTPPATPQTSVEWWQNLKTQYSDDEVGCFLSITLKLGVPGDSDPAVLQEKLDYAVGKYSTPCLALAQLSQGASVY